MAREASGVASSRPGADQASELSVRLADSRTQWPNRSAHPPTCRSLCRVSSWVAKPSKRPPDMLQTFHNRKAPVPFSRYGNSSTPTSARRLPNRLDADVLSLGIHRSVRGGIVHGGGDKVCRNRAINPPTWL